MLTFEFTDASGEMTVRERLTSGMVGRQMTVSFSDDWEGLTKTAVFLAGDICRAAEVTDSVVTIPEDVLRCPFRKLQVGIWGTNSEGTLVIPTILADGPFIERGADPTTDPVAVDIPVWRDLQSRVGTLEATVSTLTAAQDGFSIFYTDAQIGNSQMSFIQVNPTFINTNGRTIRVGDYLLTANARLANVVSADNSAVTAAFLMDLKGAAPVRGTDYWTKEDIAEIKAYIDETILGGAW